MNGRKAKALRRAARAISSGQPEKDYVPVFKTQMLRRGAQKIFDHVELRAGTTRQVYQQLKAAS